MRYKYNPDHAMHPSNTLREKLEEMGISVKKFAIKIGKSEKVIYEILNGKGSITYELAVKFEKVLKIPANFWLKKQANYNEFNKD